MSQNMVVTPGQVLYKYQLIKPIGSGGFGTVWLANDKTVNNSIAVKILAKNVDISERLKEAQIGNHLNHANLVKMHYADVIQHEGRNLVVIAMDYHSNGSILSSVNSCNFIPIPDTIRIISDILRGLEYLHELNLYHSDIKPQNILIGDVGQGVLTDYGITCYSPSGESVRHRGAYKLHIAPEILTSEHINIQTDIYQVGFTAFRLLNGIGTIQEKFNVQGEDKYYQLVKDGTVIRSKDYQLFVPRNLKSVINKAINVDPASRYQSAVEMRRALERLSYSGYWTTNSSGNYIGKNDKYEYRFEEKVLPAKLFEFKAYKKSNKSSRETRITEFCKKNLSRKQCFDLKQQFMQWVVTG